MKKDEAFTLGKEAKKETQLRLQKIRLPQTNRDHPMRS
jgi:hypothetical protein